MKVCPLSEKSIPNEACFDSHILEFVSDELYGAPKDVNHPERGYVAPPSDGIYDTSGKLPCYVKIMKMKKVGTMNLTSIYFQMIVNENL